MFQYGYCMLLHHQPATNREIRNTKGPSGIFVRCLKTGFRNISPLISKYIQYTSYPLEILSANPYGRSAMDESLRSLEAACSNKWLWYDLCVISEYLTKFYISSNNTGWWFGTWLLFFSIQLGMSSSQLTNSIIFQDGYCTTNQQQIVRFPETPNLSSSYLTQQQVFFFGVRSQRWKSWFGPMAERWPGITALQWQWRGHHPKIRKVRLYIYPLVMTNIAMERSTIFNR